MIADNAHTYFTLPGVTAQEVHFLQQITADLDEQQLYNFQTIYSTKRKNPQDILLLTLLGCVGIAGIHRIVLGQTTMGVLYLFTCGFFWVMTIMDIVNHKDLTNDYNHDMACQSYQIVKITR